MKQEGIAVSAIIVGIVACVGFSVADHAWTGLLSLAFAAWGIFALIQVNKRNRKVHQDSSFTVQEESDGQIRFDVHAAHRRSFTIPAAIFLGLMMAALVGVITGAMAGFNGSPFLLLLSPIAGIGFALAVLHRNMDRRECASDRRIYASTHTINYPDPAKDFALTMVQASTIDRLRIQQSVANKILVQAASVSPGAAVQSWGERARAKWANWFADHSYTLEIHAQGKRHVVAGGMDEVTANGLMQAVSRKIRV
ncbi:hypothetical protein [Dyella sp.]|uniref:hypothetical protein n=1 Tax=Dyella sp. TaxID=1869338 RepID=UPI002849656E|nr:hypothetical protein [Dyella sp.]MDR3445439.1 hypothetical protein [Dyella sp.]